MSPSEPDTATAQRQPVQRFLFISNQYFPNVIGGAEITVQTLVEELVRRGYHASVASLSPDGQDSVDEVNGVRVYRVGTRNLYTPFKGQHHPVFRALWHAGDVFNPPMARKLGRILDTERPDWVSAHNLGGFSVAVWSSVKARGIQLSQCLHDYYVLCPRTTMNKDGENCASPCAACRMYGAPKKAVSRLPDVVIGVSRFVLDKHLEHGFFGGARCGVVYNGRGQDVPAPPRARTAGAPLVIGFIGRIERVKGIETLLDAFSRLTPGRARLRIAGRAPDPSYLQRLKQRYPQPEVEYLGYVKQQEFYPQVDVVVVPSLWHEPLPGVVYEPLGFGVPVIAARVGGIPEILDGAKCGRLFRAGDVDELVMHLQAALDGWGSDEAARAAAFERRAAFTPERQADEFLSLIQGRTLSPALNT
jgi:glycosyltransferase involved in cell wall biosynthesis